VKSYRDHPKLLKSDKEPAVPSRHDWQSLSTEDLRIPVIGLRLIADLHGPRSRPSKSREQALEIARPQMQAPYIVEGEVDGDECGGSGFDPGGIDPWGPEPCPACHGWGTQRVTKNYLAEAFRIVGNPKCIMPAERAHLVAIVQYCRQVVSAAVSSPRGPERDQDRTDLKSSPRHRRVKAAHRYPVIPFRRRKRNVDISPQRT
jgi:hypothetical protein